MRSVVNRLNRQYRVYKPHFCKTRTPNTTLNLSDQASWENMLTIRVENQPCQALVDSGAHLSIISDGLLSKIAKKRVKFAKPKFSAVTGVGGITHTVTARVLLAVNVGGHVFEQDFHVLDGHHSVILGMDFLTDQQAVIDFQTSTIILAGTLICKLHKHAVRSSLARTVKSVFIPANSEVVFPDKVI